jgi:hypothetical protein
LKKQFQNWNWNWELAKIGTRNQGPPARIGYAEDLVFIQVSVFKFLIKEKLNKRIGFSCWD